MMEKTLRSLVLVSLLLALPSIAHAKVIRTNNASNLTAGNAGIGLQLGCPTGLALKIRLAAASSFNAEAGFGCGEDLLVVGDYLLEMGNFLEDPKNFQVSWFFGIGGRYGYDHHDYGPANKRHRSDTDLGPRVPIGVEFHFNEVKPLELYLEIAPGIDFVDDPGVTVDAAFGARWFF